ncbi:efflux RND transporter periplasmic adaptor subunit [Cupriavidus plantarum]|uniref:efflux RND transporter periplasmic adaptor subunit n=1 Tax=Cupriavidus plantarum TaxID=942865 RepID=UPI000EB5943B|nr:efflux RND transporter periplasmic adaptor subunit [Cupriavidus plantarum]NYH99251.1 multidrug efflux system membrane fusion protein [Cupriavidus plantarum]RLK44364.1 multidrug efflux system membrane fusion protein [Cupriavidus plantarum]CAG2142724.1 Multidrug resistance protein MdtA [Cupriavidus plantarum]SMR65565.1 membrane fusion protein, multidrug efflux system [Cupriavidus plantarum]
MTPTSRPHPRRLGRIAIAAIIVACVGGYVVWRVLAPKPVKAPTPPVGVTTALAQAQDVDIGLVGVGTVQAMQTVTVTPRIDGQLVSVGFVEGQDVKLGQVLARIDPRTFEAQLQQAQATRARDEATLANARLDLTRFQGLIKENATTQQTLDTQRATVAQLEASVRTDDAQIALARVQLDFTTITAPLAGRVGARLVDPGNIVHATDTTGLVVIRQIDPIDVVFTLPEEAVSQIHGATTDGAQLIVDANERESGKRLGEGKLILVNNTIDTTSGTIQLKARFPNPTHALWPGQYVDARLVLGRRARAITVPSSAIQRNDAGTYVYTVQPDNTVAMKPVTVAELQGNRAVIGKGLAAGDRVVSEGQYKLRAGAKIVETAGARS